MKEIQFIFKINPDFLSKCLYSFEYKILNHKQVNPADQHINQHYTIFNNITGMPKNMDDLLNLIVEELEILEQFDSNLHASVMSRFFAGYISIDDYQTEYPLTMDKLTYVYIKVADMLNYWRNKEIVYAL